MRRHRLTVFEPLEQRQLLTVDAVVISEFMASNDQTLDDGFGRSSDWIEIHNGSTDAVDLQGWTLTDDRDDALKWEFPEELILPPGAFLLVWASGEDTVDPEGEYHTNFKLNSDGEFLGLFSPEGRLESSYGPDNQDYPSQQTDVSYGLDAEGLPIFLFEPTPRASNVSTVIGQVADTTFSVDRGYFDSAFLLEIESLTPEATLAYTLDGSAPSPTHGEQITGGPDGVRALVSINSTSTVRAMAYRPGWLPTNVDTQTYLFPEDIVLQDGQGLPNTWGHAGADYAMDPEIVNSRQYGDEVIPGLEALPSLSLVTEQDNWFGRNGVGIYPSGQGSPRPVSAELIWADGELGFQVDGSVEIQGGTSTNRWKSDKLSMQLKFKREFGDAELAYPLFGEDAAQSFDTLIVDAQLNHVWHYGGGYEPTKQRMRAQYTRDQYVADLQNALDGQAPRGQWVHLYLNATYWGMYNLHERPDEHFAAAYLGGSEDDYDIIKHNNDVVHGGYTNYRNLIRQVNQDVASDAAYGEVVERLDVDDFVRYMLVNYFVGNVDWAHHNWYASFNRESADGQWRFHSWDAEHVLKELRHDATGRDDELGPTHIHHRLMTNEDYRLQFMDAVQAHLFNDGLLTPDRASAMYETRLEAVESALVAESARWGDNRRDEPYTRDGEWAAERDRLLNDYFPRRTEIVIEQLRDRGFFHRYDAPRFSQHGGSVSATTPVEIDSTGDEVFFTLDGSDPRTSPTALRYTGAFTLSGDVELRARGRHGEEWSAVTIASFTVDTSVEQRGDFSGDGVLDATDIDLLFAAVRGGDTSAEYDVNGDAEVDEEDTRVWIEDLAGTRPGDTNLDGRVEFGDFLQFSTTFGQADVGWAAGDFTGDGLSDFADFLLLANYFGFSSQPQAADSE